MEVVVGVVSLLLGAASATTVSRSLEDRDRLRWLPLALVPPGVLIGAGGALVRGWDLVGSMAAAAVLVPAVGMGVVVVQRRRDRRSA